MLFLRLIIHFSFYSMMQLSISELTIGYGSRSVMSGIELTARSGELICMLGRNGCGKSTLLRTIAGLQPALAGHILLNESINKANYADILKFNQTERAKLLALVLTERVSIDNTHVYDIVAMGRYPHTTLFASLSGRDKQAINSALQQVGMSTKAQLFYNELSDGDKQRVLIAKALAQDTPIILLDEPTAHLDLPNRIKTLSLLSVLAHKEGKIIIISTHELDLALRYSDKIWLMQNHNQESSIKEDSPENLIQDKSFERAFSDSSFHFCQEDLFNAPVNDIKRL